jgi:hypothetical protein
MMFSFDAELLAAPRASSFDDLWSSTDTGRCRSKPSLGHSPPRSALKRGRRSPRSPLRDRARGTRSPEGHCSALKPRCALRARRGHAHPWPILPGLRRRHHGYRPSSIATTASQMPCTCAGGTWRSTPPSAEAHRRRPPNDATHITANVGQTQACVALFARSMSTGPTRRTTSLEGLHHLRRSIDVDPISPDLLLVEA